MEILDAVTRMAALAQESRLLVFRRLVQAGPQGLAAGELGEDLDIPAPTLSFHLKDLRMAGLVNSTRDGRSIVYTANYQSINEVVTYLKDNCCRKPSRKSRRKNCC
jgi:ArsR family transcriptional regulator